MNKPTGALRAPSSLSFVLALLTLCIVLALLIVGCRHVDAKTFVLGPVSCEPETTKKRVNRCNVCMKASCCAEFLACANDAPCPCGMTVRAASLAPARALEICGPMNAAYASLTGCLGAKCAEECPADDGRAHHPLIGKPAPEITAEPVGGEGPKTLAEARGKVVILEFWATHCGPCKRSFPVYQEIVDRFRGEVAVLAISIDNPEDVSKDKILGFARDTRARFPILWDTHLRMEARYAMPKGIPAAFLIDRSGIVRSVHVGPDAQTQAEIEALVKAPLPAVIPAQEQSGSPP